MAVNLPAWLSRRDNGVFVIDPDIAYPAILKRLGVKTGDYDQYWLETAYQCAKLAAQELILGTELDPRPAATLVLIIDSGGGRKERWALRNFRTGKGAIAATGVRSLTEPSQAKVSYRGIGRHIRELDARPVSQSAGQASQTATRAKD